MNFSKESYISRMDGMEDRYLFHAGSRKIGVIVLHGHGGHEDQINLRADFVRRQDFLEKLEVDVLCPNLRDNAWMSPKAAADLAQLLETFRKERQWEKTFIAAGSMGGTGALIFGILHPELIDGLVVLGAATSLKRYLKWCEQPNAMAIHTEIHDAILAHYTEEELQLHDVCLHADKLTMPLYYWHGGKDEIIPVSEADTLTEIMENRPNFHYKEVPGGFHDSPLTAFNMGLEKLFQDYQLEVPENAEIRVKMLFGKQYDFGTIEVREGYPGMSCAFKNTSQVPVWTFNNVVKDGVLQTSVLIHKVPSPFSFLLRDVSSEHPVYIPEAGAIIVPEEDPRNYEEILKSRDNLRIQG